MSKLDQLGAKEIKKLTWLKKELTEKEKLGIIKRQEKKLKKGKKC